MLEAIHQQHKRLDDGLRRNDVITGSVLSMVEDMLLDERYRPKTIYCWTKSQRFLDEAKKKLKEMRSGTGVSPPTKRKPSPSVISSKSSTTSLEDPVQENDDTADLSLGTFQLSLVDSPERVATEETKVRFNNTEPHHNGSNQTFYYQHRPLARNGSAVGSELPNPYPQMGHQLQNSSSRRGTHQLTQSVPMNNDGHRIRLENGEDDAGELRCLPNHRLHAPRMPRVVSMPSSLTRSPEESFQKTPQRGLSTQARRDPGIFTPGAYADPDLSQQRYPFNNHLKYSSISPGTYTGDNRNLPWDSSQQHQDAGFISPPPNQTLFRPPHNSTFQNPGDNSDSHWLPPTSGPSQPVNISQSSEYLSPPIPITPEPSIKHEPPAILQVGTASAWRTRRGKINELPGDFLFDRLKARDHVFIIDDALSMSKYWQELLPLFEVLTYMVKSADPDGIDLHFTMSDEKFNSKDGLGRNSSRKLVSIVENREKKKKIRGTSNITYRLASILAPYEAKLTNSHNLRRGSTIRPLNIYMLTDGVWEHRCDASSAIRKIVSKLIEFGYTKDSKQIGIQFIRFDSDPVGAKKLEYLDDNLEQEMDIVDITPCNGNVWKMLLGAIDKTFDEAYEAFEGPEHTVISNKNHLNPAGMSSELRRHPEFEQKSVHKTEPIEEDGIINISSSRLLQYPEFKGQEIPTHPIKTGGISSDITSVSRQSMIFSAAANTGISSDLESVELARDSSVVGERDEVVGVKKLSFPCGVPVSDLNENSEHANSKSEAPEDAHDDLKSVVSYNDDIASQVSARIMIHEVTAEKILAFMLAKHVELKPLFEIALTRTNTSRFENNFRRVLKRYYLDLVQFANTNLERATVQIIRSRGARIRVSRDIAQQIRPDHDEDSNSLILKDFENRKQDLENWIASNSYFARPAEPHITNDEVDRDGPPTMNAEVDLADASSDSESDSGEHPYIPSVADMKKFMLGGYSFRLLTTNMRRFLLPSASLPLYRVLFTIPSYKITFSSENNDSCLNKLKIFVEDYTEDDWNWWPLQPRMRPLAEDQTRVTWECHCGTLQWAEIPSSQVDTYRLILGTNVTLQNDHLCTHRQRVPWRISLLKSMQKLAGPASIATQPPMATGSTSQPISLQNIQPTASSTSIHQDPSPPFYPTQTAIPNQQGVPINLPGSNLDLYVLFGVKGSRRTIDLAQLEVRNNYNDSAFFKDLKDEYRRRRGFWRYWLSIWQLRYCDFVKFKKIMANRIISHSTGLPEDNIYEYKPRPPNAEMPPIHPHEFELAFSACSSDGFCSLFHDCIKLPTGRCFAVERIPKLKGRFEINTDDFQDAWGIQARYAISFLNMVLYHLFIIATTFGFWAWWMVVHPDDLQNAAVPLTIVLALISLFWSSAGVLKIFREPE